MKLIRFLSKDSSEPEFGIVIANYAVAFSALQAKSGIVDDSLCDSQAYLSHLPESERAARTLLEWGEAHLQEIGEGERPALDATQLMEPIEVTALFDFGLTPRHLENSFETIMKY